jgi:hypothetical protein
MSALGQKRTSDDYERSGNNAAERGGTRQNHSDFGELARLCIDLD